MTLRKRCDDSDTQRRDLITGIARLIAPLADKILAGETTVAVETEVLLEILQIARHWDKDNKCGKWLGEECIQSRIVAEAAGIFYKKENRINSKTFLGRLQNLKEALSSHRKHMGWPDENAFTAEEVAAMMRRGVEPSQGH